MVRIEEEESGVKVLKVDPSDIETPWNRCPSVYWAEVDFLQDYRFGAMLKKGEYVIKENQPDNRHRSWWQSNHSLAIIRELCKHQDLGYMMDKVETLEKQVNDMNTQFITDRREFEELTEKDKRIFDLFELMADTRVRPLFEEANHKETIDALNDCLDMTIAIGKVRSSYELPSFIRRCKRSILALEGKESWKIR